MSNTQKSMALKTTVIVAALMGMILAGIASGASPLLDPNALADIGLRIAWQRPLPIYEDETLEQFVLRDDRLFLLTSGNYAIAIQRDNGSTIFMKRMAPKGFEVNGWQLSEDGLLSSIGEVLTVMGPNTGTVRGYKDFKVNLTDAPASNTDGVYLAGRDHRIHAIGRKDHVVHYQVGAKSGAAVTAVAAGGHGVVLATSAGDVMALTSGTQPIIRWEFQARDAVAAPLVIDADRLYFASRDSYVYRLNLDPRAKRLVWRTQCDALLDTAPLVTASVVYQALGCDSMMALDKETGAALWTQTGVCSLLAQSGPWAYLWTEDQKIVVMDNEKGQWAHMIAAPGLVYACTNTQDAEIYLADDQGRIVCLTPVHP